MKKPAKKKATPATSKPESKSRTKSFPKLQPNAKNTGGDMHATPDGKYDSKYKAGDEVW